MRKSRFTEEQIIKVLKDMQLVCRLRSCAGSTASASRHSTSGRSRYGGMEVSDACKLKALEDKNRQLKKLLAEPILDAATLKEMLGKPSNTQLAETTCDLAGPNFIARPL